MLLRRLRNYKVIWSIAGFLFSVVVVGVVIEVVNWQEIPRIVLYPTLFAIFLSSALLFWYGCKLAKHQRPKSGRNRKVISILWQKYKCEQELVEKRGKRGLPPEKMYLVKSKAQQQMKVPTISVTHKLSDSEAEKIAAFMIKKMKAKMRDKINLNKHTLQQMNTLSGILDYYKIGVASVIKHNQNYQSLKEKSKDIRAIGDIKSLEVRNISQLSITLNSTLLSYLYLKSEFERALENKPDFPYDLFKDGLDDMMLDRLNSLELA